MKIDSNLLLFYLSFSKKFELYIIYNQFQFLKTGKILKFLTEENQYK